MKRSEAIEWLESIQENYAMQEETQEVAEALELAIFSLKTDDYFEAMSNDVEVYTRADVISMLKNLQLEIEVYKSDRLVDMERTEMAEIFSEIVQRKISLLTPQI